MPESGLPALSTTRPTTVPFATNRMSTDAASLDETRTFALPVPSVDSTSIE